jgi:hypothetical protein
VRGATARSAARPAPQQLVFSLGSQHVVSSVESQHAEAAVFRASFIVRYFCV